MIPPDDEQDDLSDLVSELKALLASQPQASQLQERIVERFEAMLHSERIESETLSCADWQDLFDQALEVEMGGESLPARKPRFWEHIQGCPDCLPAYEQLRAFAGIDGPIGTAQAPGALPGAPPEPGWRLDQRPRPGGGFELQVRMLGAFLWEQLFGRPLSAAMRDEPTAPRGPQRQPVLLERALTLGNIPAELEILATQAPGQQDAIVLEAILLADEALPSPLYAQVGWEQRVYTVPLSEEGEGVLGTFPIDAFRQGQELVVTLTTEPTEHP